MRVNSVCNYCTASFNGVRTYLITLPARFIVNSTVNHLAKTIYIITTQASKFGSAFENADHKILRAAFSCWPHVFIFLGNSFAELSEVRTSFSQIHNLF